MKFNFSILLLVGLLVLGIVGCDTGSAKSSETAGSTSTTIGNDTSGGDPAPYSTSTTSTTISNGDNNGDDNEGDNTGTTTTSSTTTTTTTTTTVALSPNVASSDLSEYLSRLSADGGPYDIQITDKQPDLNVIYDALDANPTKNVNLDLSLCTRLSEIGADAFAELDNLYNIIIPDRVTTIGDFAFYRCHNLQSINIPLGVESIGDNTFKECDCLEVTVVAAKWRDCISNILNNVPNINILASSEITEIPNNAFRADKTSYGHILCTKIKSVTISDGVTYIGYNAFYGCSGITSVTIPDSVKTIEFHAFYGCSGLTNITISGAIASNAFEGCWSLMNVTLTNGVTAIGQEAFKGCNFTEIVIPNSVTSMDWFVFRDCYHLEKITLPFTGFSLEDTDDAYITKIFNPGNTAVNEGKTSYECRLPSSLSEVIISEGLTSIGDWAFSNCSGLTSITIPGSVTSIEDYAFNNCVGLTTVIVKATTPPSFSSYMFSKCSALTTIYVPNASVSAYQSANGWSDYADKIKAITE